MKQTRQAKNQSAAYTLAGFSYFMAGTVLRKPFFGCGVPILGFLAESAALLVFSYFCARYFSRRQTRGTRAPSGFFSVAFSAFVLALCASVMARFLDSLAYFDADYGTPGVILCAGAACIFCVLVCAARAKIAINSFLLLTAVPFALWSLWGFLAFFTTKRAFPIASPFGAWPRFGALLAEGVYVCLDTVFLAMLLCGGESEETRKLAPRAFMRAAALYVLFAGAGLFKNLLLFGADLANDAAYPDLAAVRLVPFFDLPELSVLINTFACTAKLGVYAACGMTLLKESFGARYCRKTVCGVYAFTLGALGAAFYRFRQSSSADMLDRVVLGLFCLAALCGFVLYSKPVRRVSPD